MRRKEKSAENQQSRHRTGQQESGNELERERYEQSRREWRMRYDAKANNIRREHEEESQYPTRNDSKHNIIHDLQTRMRNIRTNARHQVEFDPTELLKELDKA
eukprot:368095_1